LLLGKALEINQRVLGKVHPDTATSFNNVACNLDALGKYDEAEPLFRKSYEMLSDLIGEQHLNTKTALANWQAIRLKK
jgi:tetratricopeptide (TPR) repeat protein